MTFGDGRSSLKGSLPKKFREQSPPPDVKIEDRYDEWGFTIYRTAYGGYTDVHWEALIQTIHANVRAHITRYHDENTEKRIEGEEDAGRLLLDLFRLDARSGLNLEGKSLDDLRDLYHKEPFYSTRFDTFDTKHYAKPAVFFVAGAEVLKLVENGTYVFKAVDMDFYEREYKPHPRFQQHYWGWMPMTPIAVLSLYQMLHESKTLEEIAPSSFDPQNIKTWTHSDQT